MFNCAEEYMRKFSRKFEPVSTENGNNAILPIRGTKFSAGYDLFAAQDVMVYPGVTAVIPTGIKASMPFDEYLQVTLRSSFAIKNNLFMPNSPAIIDSDYYNNENNEGELFVAVLHYNEKPQMIYAGDKIAQGIFLQYGLTHDDNNTGKVRMAGSGSTDATVLPS